MKETEIMGNKSRLVKDENVGVASTFPLPHKGQFFLTNFRKYCLLVRYSFTLDSFEASQAVYRNLWYIESPL
jgi:hypothetical protein